MNNTLYKLTQLDFYAVDLQLYLDTHPNDAKAIAEYNKTINDAQKLRSDYEQTNGPLTSKYLSPAEKFDWIDEPWTWEEQYN
ncbi:MAG: spore coat protein CotJB [Clostridiales bacterium]|jgi:spore coat protein JB|nr:spore coat protein CotJB [Clostridiales bacterium]